MDEQIVQQIFDELLSSLEPLDTQNAALLQFLKAKGIATDEELAPFLEQAGNASNVRWLGARVRIRSLIASAMKPAEDQIETESAKSTSKNRDKSPEPAAGTSEETAEAKKTESNVQSGQASGDNEKSKKTVPDVAGQDESKKESKNTNSEKGTEKTKATNQDGKEDAA
jgi:hypothetical protein